MKKFLLFILVTATSFMCGFAAPSNPSDTTDGKKIIDGQVCKDTYYYKETCPDRARDVKIDISKIGNKDDSSSSSNSKDNSNSSSSNGSSSSSNSGSSSSSSYGSNSGSSSSGSSSSNKSSSGSDSANKSENCQSTTCGQENSLYQQTPKQ